MTPVIENTVLMNFTSALQILAVGMAGIFLFMGLFYLLIYSLELIFKEKKEA